MHEETLDTFRKCTVNHKVFHYFIISMTKNTCLGGILDIATFNGEVGKG